MVYSVVQDSDVQWRIVLYRTVTYSIVQGGKEINSISQNGNLIGNVV